MENYKDDIQHIRRIMERSSSFISLSGWSGISAGIIAIMGAVGSWILFAQHQINYFDGQQNNYSNELIYKLLCLAIMTLALAGIAAFYFTNKKAKRLNMPLWSSVTKHMLIQLAVPLIAGGLFCLSLLWYKLFYLVAPSTLVFYGLSLTSASKYMNRELFNLGLLEIVLGLVGILYPGYGLILWSVGFGLLHIVYGTYMQINYK